MPLKYLMMKVRSEVVWLWKKKKLPVSQQLAEIDNLRHEKHFSVTEKKKKCCSEPSLPTGSRVSSLATAVIISQLRLKPARVCSSVSPDKPHRLRLAAHVYY